MAQDHSVLGLQLLFSFLSSSSNSPKWCVHVYVLDLLGRAVPMELLFFFLQGIVYGMELDTCSPNKPKIGTLLASLKLC